ncbi:MAG: alpha/beta fold hydrolase [Dehalococcoidia bacterium]|jgi:pimeloyl-ACP methyl ester carboxylesterase|nr:alpha/beta fold hydrolase [Dehalococcoidia bacterium]
MEIINFEITKNISIKGFSLIHSKNDQLLFFVHGLASNSSLFLPLANKLFNLGYSSIGIDLRGHGNSSKPTNGYTLETFSKDISTIIRKYLKNKPIFIGQSMGANLGVMLAKEKKPIIQGCICIDGGFINLKNKFSNWKQCEKQLTPPNLDHLQLPKLKELLQSYHPDWSELSIQGTLNNWKIFNNLRIKKKLSIKKHLLLLKSLWSQKPNNIYQLNVSTLLINSTIKPNFQNLPPNTKMITLEGDHDIHAQKPDLMSKMINDEISKGFFR